MVPIAFLGNAMLVVPVWINQAFEAKIKRRSVPDLQRRVFSNSYGIIWISEANQIIDGNEPVCSQ